MTYFISAGRAGEISTSTSPSLTLESCDCKLVAGFLATSIRGRQTEAENMVKFGVTRTKETPMVVGLLLDDFDPTEPDVGEPFWSLVGHLMWPANQTRPDILNAVRAVFSRTKICALKSGLACSHVC